MSPNFDPTEFVDGDLQAQKPKYASVSTTSQPARAPTREERDSEILEKQQRLAQLKREQEELERARAGLEETRRRQLELHTSQQEMVQHLTRGLGLLEEAEFNTRRDAEQMAKALTDLRDALAKVEAIHEESWTKETFEVELTRALTTLENARMEWNSARLKFPVLSGTPATPDPEIGVKDSESPASLDSKSFFELCRYGLALTWPVAAATLVGVILLVLLLLRR